MSETPCDCCNTEGDHPSRIICDACFQSVKGKAKCCIDAQAENKQYEEALNKIVANEAIVIKGLSKILLPSKIWSGVISESSNIATKALQEKP